jgi:DNA-binding winged helix-turn-helix (wHTH) protein/Tol biopolymer transport system component
VEPDAQGPSGYRFGVFEVNLRTGELRKHGLRVKFQDQPFKVLAMLLKRAPEMVSRDELRSGLWRDDTFVDFDHSLSIAINKVREALCDSSDFPRYVETLPKRGYRFIAPVEALPAVLPKNGAARSSPRADEPAAAPAVPVAVEDSALPAPEPHLPVRVAQTEPAAEPRRAASIRETRWLRYAIAGGLGAILIAAGFAYRKRPAVLPPLKYQQLTNFTDAAFAPAISPDGRMLAFLRGTPNPFMTTGQVYIKLLPNGEPVQLTSDPRLKAGVTFSPDGTRINYTVTDPNRWGWDTVSVSALGGDPSMTYLNAAGLSWVEQETILFSKVKTGLHMGVATASEDRSDEREIYFPQHERAMALGSHASPDRKWVLIIEKDEAGIFLPCRVVPFDGSSSGQQVGPLGQCTAGGWSPDGSVLYLTATVNGASHLWRQSFPSGAPEQMTFGPAEEEDVAVAPDGSGLITSIGTTQSTLWLHDGKQDSQVTSEGYVSLPRFSPDARTLYYLLRRDSPGAPNELWAADLITGKRRPIVQHSSISRYDVSPDQTEIVFDTEAAAGKAEIWIAATDGGRAATRVPISRGDRPFWAPGGDLLFRRSENNRNYLFRARRDGSSVRKVSEHPINQVQVISPDLQWVTAPAPLEGTATAVIAIPVDGGPIRQICPGICTAKWSPDSSYFYFRIEDNADAYREKMIAIPIPNGSTLPSLPFPLASMEQAAELPGSVPVGVDVSGNSQVFVPGLKPDTYAYTKISEHRNLFWISLR